MAKRVNIPSSQYLSGLDAVIDNLNYAMQGIEDSSIEGLKSAISKVMADASDNAPLDQGDLRRSVVIDEPISEDGFTSIRAGFNVPYAAPQHEHTEYVHPKGGEAKFLENSLIRNQQRIVHLVAGEILE